MSKREGKREWKPDLTDLDPLPSVPNFVSAFEFEPAQKTSEPAPPEALQVPATPTQPVQSVGVLTNCKRIQGIQLDGKELSAEQFYAQQCKEHDEVQVARLFTVANTWGVLDSDTRVEFLHTLLRTGKTLKELQFDLTAKWKTLTDDEKRQLHEFCSGVVSALRSAQF